MSPQWYYEHVRDDLSKESVYYTQLRSTTVQILVLAFPS